MRRFGLRDAQWGRIKEQLAGREGSVGVTASDNRLLVEAVLDRYRIGMPWRGLPERFGDGTKAHLRLSRTTNTG
jgi:transposase